MYPEFLYKKCALFHYITNEMENIDTPFEKRKVNKLGRVEVAVTEVSEGLGLAHGEGSGHARLRAQVFADEVL